MEHLFEVGPDLRVDCRLSVGAVRVVAAPPGHARVELTAHGEVGEELLRRGEVKLYDDGGSRQRLVVHLPARNLFSGLFSITGRGGVTVTIHAPDGCELHARTGAADVHAGLDLAAVDVVTGTGDVTLGDVAHDAAVKVATGHVRVGTVGGALDVDTAAGAVDAGAVQGPVRIRTASGAIALGRTCDAVKVTAAAGDVGIACAERGRVAVTATTGDVTIGVPPGRRLHLDVSSTIGSIRSELEETSATSDGGADLEIRVRATTGDVDLRRAVSSAS
ncbi:DUF4097 domain-containing protein [Egicoccus sp. AB-alg6-2]|uniref:DUF4097 family beta strand repeat-containing protein n=1 Tax=Egicoccus sp. AB-alg6-2 TaxID=3242692 RepID=UPI00359DBB05